MKTEFLSIILLKYIIHGVGLEYDTLSKGFLIDDDESVQRDNLFHSRAYPEIGDIPVLNRKVFRASRVTIREHAYIASIRREYAHYLTGSLISRNTVLTVANPLHDVPINELGVVVGENYSDRGTSLLTVIFVLIHQNFDPYTLTADIAMVRFYEDVVFRSNIKNIRILSPTSNIKGTAIVTGWGRCDFMLIPASLQGNELCLQRASKYYPDEIMDPMLRSISFPIGSENHYCEGYNKHQTPLREGMLCAGDAREESAVSSCLAVPGAPLLVNSELVGILSWGFGCGYLNDLPLVYTNIQYYTPWLIRNMQILRTILKKNVTDLFICTKSYRLLRWLNKTRQEKPFEHEHTKLLQQTDIDVPLSQLEGRVYDIRDYIYNKMYRESKEEMYGNIKLALTNTSVTYPKYEIITYTFLDNSSLNMDYYFDNFEDG